MLCGDEPCDRTLLIRGELKATRGGRERMIRWRFASCHGHAASTYGKVKQHCVGADLASFLTLASIGQHSQSMDHLSLQEVARPELQSAAHLDSSKPPAAFSNIAVCHDHASSEQGLPFHHLAVAQGEDRTQEQPQHYPDASNEDRPSQDGPFQAPDPHSGLLSTHPSLPLLLSRMPTDQEFSARGTSPTRQASAEVWSRPYDFGLTITMGRGEAYFRQALLNLDEMRGSKLSDAVILKFRAAGTTFTALSCQMLHNSQVVYLTTRQGNSEAESWILHVWLASDGPPMLWPEVAGVGIKHLRTTVPEPHGRSLGQAYANLEIDLDVLCLNDMCHSVHLCRSCSRMSSRRSSMNTAVALADPCARSGF